MPGASESAMWPRAEHLQRIFNVRSGDKTGTAFALDVDERQYLVSALHVVERAVETSQVDIHFNDQWATTKVDVVGYRSDSDIAVLALETRIVGPNLNIEVSGAGSAAGQEVFFLGYPLGIRSFTVEPGFPLPVVKRGTVALFDPSPLHSVFISGSANPGFSGGPVYFMGHTSGKATLMAVIIEELGYEVPVKNAAGEKIGSVLTGSNIVRCTYVDRVLELIRGKPIGLSLT